MKSLDEMLQPDPRFAHFMTYGSHGELRRMTFADHYAMAADLELPISVPSRVKRNWELALQQRNPFNLRICLTP